MFGSIFKAVGSVAAPLISGGATLLGGMLQNNSAKAQANRQMEFQEDMSNTSYQRAMEDMRQAGLNPILAAKVGGASTPSGSAAPVENILAPAVNSALAARMQNAQIANLAETNAQIRSQTALNTANTAKSIAETEQLSKTGQHGWPHKLGGSNLTDLIDTIFGRTDNGPKASEINKPILDKMRQDAMERAAGFRANSSKSIPVINVAPRGMRASGTDWVPPGVLLPPKY